MLKKFILLAALASCSDATSSAPVIITTDDDAKFFDPVPEPTEVPQNNRNNQNNVDPNNVPDWEDAQIIFEENDLETALGSSLPITFTVPENSRSVVIDVVGKDGIFYALASWQNGDGEFLVPTNWAQQSQIGPSLCVTCPNRIAGSEVAFAALAPNNQDVSLVPGEHTISLLAYQASGNRIQLTSDQNITVRVTANTSQEKETGNLSLNLYFTGAQGLTADSAPDDANFQQTIDGVKSIYADAGILIDKITYNDADQAFRIIENIAQPGSDLQRLFALSNESSNDGLNLFFVDELMATSGGGFGVILGVSGGIPGPTAKGTGRSGVAIAIKPNPQIPSLPEVVIAHEMGHHLGLFHSSEQSQFGPQIHDQISDTQDNDRSLLMYFAGTGRTLSANQITVIRSNPRVRF